MMKGCGGKIIALNKGGGNEWCLNEEMQDGRIAGTVVASVFLSSLRSSVFFVFIFGIVYCSLSLCF